jgi:hypothetical protein
MACYVVFAPEASDQLEELFLYIAEESSPTIAQRYTDASSPPARAWRCSPTEACHATTSGPAFG